MKVILYMAISADGFIAGRDGRTPWSEEEWRLYSAFVRSKGSIIIGRRTFDIMKDEELERIGDPFTVVLSTAKSDLRRNNIQFVTTPQEAIAVLKNRGFSETVLGGGAATNKAFSRVGLIDEVILDVEQVILGDGKRLFEEKTKSVRLELVEERKITKQLIQKHYRVVR